MVSRSLLAIFFIVAGSLHFFRPAFYLSMMPSWVPLPYEMVLVSGFFEVLLGGLVFISKTRRLAGWGLIALLIVVFPANLHAVFHPEIFPNFPVWVLWARLPFQGIFVWWVWKACF